MRAAGLARGGEIPDAEEMPGYLRKAGGGILGDMNDADIMALAFIVMMEAAKRRKRISSRSWQGQGDQQCQGKNRGNRCRRCARRAATRRIAPRPAC